MRIVFGQGQQPVIVESEWWRGDRDELQVILKEGESVHIPVLDIEDIEVGVDKDNIFYVDVSSDATESTERVYERKIETE